MSKNLAGDSNRKYIWNQKYFYLLQSLENARSGAKFFKLLKEALNEGYPVDYAPEGYSTLLHIFNKREGITKLLLDVGSDVNVTDPSGRNALMLATRSRYPTLITEIVGKTNDLDKIDTEKSGLTVYGMLCQRFLYTGEQEILSCIRYLLERGANPEIGKNFAAGLRDLDVEDLEIYKYQFEMLQKLETFLALYPQKSTTNSAVYDYEL
ncbi:hypothetical protein [uncultured Cloacibacillus sp.]|uniref:hypothetical protein n=1 Tax=uncultured Cloacibacillus sp. TaxID=889794 RepID=UPI0026DD6C9D|nr:hypothetical protein [uncultured Cloacibacillus sp.]